MKSFPARANHSVARRRRKRWPSSTGAHPDGVTLHDLRRTLGSWQAKTGASLAIIGKSLNHKSMQATAIYARLHPDPVRESVERATAAMLTAAGIKPTAEVKPIKPPKPVARVSAKRKQAS